MTKYALVGDVGGTNARLALCDIASGESRRLRPIQGLITPASKRSFAFILKNIRSR
ncbi:glucokinase [Escherichia coli]|uniref:Glucokinase n=1 Tax=Escherichia coli TaxID=562 RepID=A0A377A5Z8_ECOLX|nr:glucokinase [Escherichia coli]